MSATLDLYIDISSTPAKIVAPLTGGRAPSITGFYQGSRLQVRVFPVKATGAVASAAYAAIPVSLFSGIKLAIGPRAGAVSPYALAGDGSSYTFTAQSTADADGIKDYWYGELNLNTTEMNSAISTRESIACQFEVQLGVSGAYRTMLQLDVTIWAAVIDPSGAISLPTSADQYLTLAQALAQFVAWNSIPVTANRGKTIVLVSPDGAKTREIGIANDGTPTDNLT